ncbi:MAG: 2-dehydropantoate 2-reductase [Candidatus Hydrogenedentota bacterium]
MKVAVIGPGAMGILFATRLQSAGIATTLVDYKPDRVKRFAKSGLRVDVNGTEETAKPSFSTLAPAGQDLFIVLTKSYATESLKLPPSIPVLTLQNGLGNVEHLCKIVGSSNVISGTTSEASTLLGEGHIRHAAPGTTTIGSWTSCSTEIAEKVLSTAGFNVVTTTSPGQMLWEKTVINAGINPLTAILNVPNGRLVEIKEIRELMRDLVVEAAKVASTEGYRFESSLVEKTEQVCFQTGTNISSMLQDIRAGRQTEINSISGEILRRGEFASLQAPRTRAIYQVIKGLELSR